ncbi:MAG: O-antigen ligase family protein [Ilumatobacter sp.]
MSLEHEPDDNHSVTVAPGIGDETDPDIQLDLIQPTTTGPARLVARSDLFLSVGVISFVLAASLSDVTLLSVAGVAIGILALLIPVFVARHHPVTRSAVIILGLWILSALVAQSLPGFGDGGAIRAWAETEGRALVVIGVMAAMPGLRAVRTFERLMRLSVAVISASVAVALVLHVVRNEFGQNSTFSGLTSSHHVIGYLTATSIVALIALPQLFPSTTVRLVLGCILGNGLLLSGSRAALAACLFGILVVVWQTQNRRVLLMAAGSLIVMLIGAVAVSDRIQDTAEIFSSTEFFRDARTAYEDGTTDRARSLSNNEARTNILIRFALWGNAADQFTSSPLIGIGRFRTNDTDLEFSGIENVAYVATSGDSLFNDAQPHNQVIHLLVETGAIGTLAVCVPFVIAWRRSSGSSRDGAPDTADEDGSRGEPSNAWTSFGRVQIGQLAVVGLASAGLLTSGLGLIAVIYTFGAFRVGELLASETT